MRFSPNGQRLVFVDGLGQRPPLPLPTIREADQTESILSFGHDPCWQSESEVLYRDHATGEVLRSLGPLWNITRTGILANEITAGGLWWAYSLASEHAVTIVGRGTLPDSFEPSMSADGHWLARRRHSTGHLVLRSLQHGAEYEVGPGTRARWSSATVCWEWSGRVYGRSTPEQPTAELTIPGRACYFPVPVWDGAELWVLMVCDEGQIVCAEWGSLVAKQPMGYVIGTSGGSAFALDAIARAA